MADDRTEARETQPEPATSRVALVGLRGAAAEEALAAVLLVLDKACAPREDAHERALSPSERVRCVVGRYRDAEAALGRNVKRAAKRAPAMFRACVELCRHDPDFAVAALGVEVANELAGELASCGYDGAAFWPSDLDLSAELRTAAEKAAAKKKAPAPAPALERFRVGIGALTAEGIPALGGDRAAQARIGGLSRGGPGRYVLELRNALPEGWFAAAELVTPHSQGGPAAWVSVDVRELLVFVDISGAHGEPADVPVWVTFEGPSSARRREGPARAMPYDCEDCGDTMQLGVRRRRCPGCALLVCAWCWGHVHGRAGHAQAVVQRLTRGRREGDEPITAAEVLTANDAAAAAWRDAHVAHVADLLQSEPGRAGRSGG